RIQSQCDCQSATQQEEYSFVPFRFLAVSFCFVEFLQHTFITSGANLNRACPTDSRRQIEQTACQPHQAQQKYPRKLAENIQNEAYRRARVPAFFRGIIPGATKPDRRIRAESSTFRVLSTTAIANTPWSRN